MSHKTIIAACALSFLGAGTAFAQSQPNPIQGTPGSVFPFATPSEVTIVNGVPCRTELIHGVNQRVIVGCAGPGLGRPADITTTGSVGAYPVPQAAGVANPFPFATRSEIQYIGGVPCRTVLIPGTNRRVVATCAQ